MPAPYTLILAFTLACLLPCGLTEQCKPSCADKPSGSLVANPYDCTQFYVCIADGELSHAVECSPPTGVFDPISGMCVVGDSCEPLCAPPACQFRCNTPLEKVPDPDDCTKYFICGENGGEPIGPYTCNSNTPYFGNGSCVSDPSVCCKPSCDLYCSSEVGAIPDPHNCNAYYFCMEEGIPNESFHAYCPPNHVFSPYTATCMEDVPCHTLCPISTTTSTTTSTVFTTKPPPTTTSTSTTTYNPCYTVYLCRDNNNHEMCPFCDPRYFTCPEIGEEGVPSLCDDGMVFNTNPDYPYCVDASHCPYSPPFLE